jgi:hypothetical protein
MDSHRNICINTLHKGDNDDDDDDDDDFILAYCLSGGGLQVTPDLNKRSKTLYPSTYRMLCAMLISVIFCSSVVEG